MRLQQALQLEPSFNGKVEYVARGGKFTYYFGYGANDWVRYAYDKNQSEWNESEVNQAIEYFRSHVDSQH